MNTSKINIYNIFGISLWFIMAIIINYTMITKSSDIEKNINETEVFYYEIQPELFNWTNGIDGNMFNYTPSLQNYPDLPYWIHYKFKEKNKFGYIYGTPPISSENQIKLDIVGLNRMTYQVLKKVIQLYIKKKEDLAKYEVQFKINNLNIEDMFEQERIKSLLDIFRQHLWRESEFNVYMTKLASTRELGQRVPLDPKDQEGVVVFIGSATNFSSTLYELEKEISSLHKLIKCPKDFKRTSVERYFRNNNFNLDWCSFRLVILSRNNYIKSVSNENFKTLKNYEENIWELMEPLHNL